MSNNPYYLLQGVRVVELTTYVAAPSAGRILADWGAECIKVEAPPRGDTTRFAVPLPGMRPLAYDIHNANKKSIALNLKTPEGLEAMHKLLATADVFLTNTRPAALKKIGMDYETLSAKYPHLVHAQLSGFGETGPMANDAGFDNTCFWAFGGAMYATMEKGTSPMIPLSAFADNCTACTMAAAICGALYKQKCTGEGSKVVVSLYGQALWGASEPLLSIQCSDRDQYPKSRLENTPLNNTYECKDGKWIMVCCHEYERYFPYFMKIFGREELIDDPEISTFDGGNRNSKKVIALLEQEFKKFTRDEADKALRDNDIPHAILTNIPELLESEQAWDNKYLRKYVNSEGDTFVEVQSPAKFGGVTEAPREAAPLLGQQTSFYLKQLGYTDEQIQAMLDAGIAMEKKA